MEAKEMQALIKETINAVLDERNRIEAEKHAADHAFIEFLRQREKRRQEIWVSVKKNVIAFLITSALIGIGTLVWNGWLAINGKPPKTPGSGDPSSNSTPRSP